MSRLERAANAGHPCPSNGVLAGAIGASSSSNPVNVMARLQKRGLITVERFATSRIVTITATGKSTFGDRSKAPHWRVAGAKNPGAYTGKGRRPDQLPLRERVAITPEAMPEPVDRTPCPRCGVRADFGCQHSRAAEAAYQARYNISQKDGASIAPAPVPTSAGSHSADVLSDLAKVKALFQMRAIATVMGCPSIIRDVDGDGLMLTVEPLQFIPAGRTQEGAGVDTPSDSSANDFNRFHEAVQ